MWFYNAAFETESILNIHSGGDTPLYRLHDCYAAIAAFLRQSTDDALTQIQVEEYEQLASQYEEQAKNWTMPDEL